MNEPKSATSLAPKEFYELAHDRTRRYLGSNPLKSVCVGISASSKVVSTFPGQVMALTLANLTARSCSRAVFAFPDVELHPQLKRNVTSSLHSRVEAEVYGANPFGSFVFGTDGCQNADYIIQIGKPDNRVGGFNIVIDGSGWASYIGRDPDWPASEHISLNPIGPAMAACLAQAEAFKEFLGVQDHLRIKHRVLSLYDFSVGDGSVSIPSIPEPDRIELGNAQMIGVGSVGSAVLYLIDMLPAYGILDLIEPQKVEFVNLDRALIFMADDVGRPKVRVGGQWLAGRNLHVDEYTMPYADFVKTYGRNKAGRNLDMVLLLANEDNIYADIQNIYPPIVMYGTTTAGWGINLGRHIPLKEECVLCRYPNSVTPVFKCATAEVVVSEIEERVDASLPFLSAAAGVLTVAELIKAQLDVYPVQGNFAFLDLMGGFGFLEVSQRDKSENCICRHQSLEVYRGLLGNSRWGSLSI